MSPQGDLEERVARLEELLERAIAKAAQHPVGRKILVLLGLK